jgi:hypothetical protein
LQTSNIIISNNSLKLINTKYGNEKRNLGDLLSLIKYPLLTEKAINLYSKQQYTFIVDKSLTKTEIKYILEKYLTLALLV